VIEPPDRDGYSEFIRRVREGDDRAAEQVRFHQRRRRDVRRLGTTGPEESVAGATDATASQLVSQRELLEMVRGRLSAEEREVADLRAQGLDWEAVAGTLGGTAEGRRKQLARAVSRVGQELGWDSVAD
jgi:RNA polymerase sigma-70 factor (ECF subfamily)